MKNYYHNLWFDSSRDIITSLVKSFGGKIFHRNELLLIPEHLGKEENFVGKVQTFAIKFFGWNFY